MKDLRLLVTTALTPTIWGTTYVVTSELLPPGRPLLAGVLRALPAGILLIAAVALLAGRRALPSRSWVPRAAVLGGLNIGVFFGLLFVAAYRLPGGIAAVLGAIGPFVVAGLAVPLLGERVSRRVLVASAIGVAGVALLVLRSTVALDPVGLVAAAAAPVVMGLGTVLGRRWGTPGGYARRSHALLALSGWQLTTGGLLLLPAALAIEGPPPALTTANLAGFGYLTLVGTALAYALWLGGVTALSPARVTLLTLLSPLTATVLGWLVLDQALSRGQLVGAVAVLGAVLLGAAPQHLFEAPTRGPREAGEGHPDTEVGSDPSGSCRTHPRLVGADLGCRSWTVVVRS